jgi:hypothetical protein
MEMASQWLSLDDFNWTIAASEFTMTGEHYDAIRRALAQLRAQWNALAPSSTMSLRFEPGRAVTVSDEGTIS